MADQSGLYQLKFLAEKVAGAYAGQGISVVIVNPVLVKTGHIGRDAYLFKIPGQNVGQIGNLPYIPQVIEMIRDA